MDTQQIAQQLAQIARMTNELQMALRPPPPIVKAVQPAPRPTLKPATKQRRTRAYFYLRVLPTGVETNDIIYRVVGPGGLTQANRIEQDITLMGGRAERLNSHEYALLVESRRQAIKHGTATEVLGALDAITLTGAK